MTQQGLTKNYQKFSRNMGPNYDNLCDLSLLTKEFLIDIIVEKFLE